MNMKEDWGFLAVIVVVIVGIIGLVYGMSHTAAEQAIQIAHQAKYNIEGPCFDRAVLLATTAGSPNDAICMNRMHRMEVQPVTAASREEGIALVFCKCVRPAAADAGAP